MKEESYYNSRSAQEEAAGGKNQKRAHKRGNRHPVPEYRPSMPARIIGALLCLLLAAGVIYGIAQPGLFLTDKLCGLLRGLTGNGSWFAVPALLLAFFFLLFRRRRPVWGRMAALVLLPVAAGAFLHVLFTLPDTYGIGAASFPLLWADGLRLDCGGVLGGFLGISFTAWFGRIGGGALLVLLTLLLLAGVFHLTPGRIARMAAHAGEYDDTVAYDDSDAAQPAEEAAPAKQAELPLPEPVPAAEPEPAGGMFAGLRKKIAPPKEAAKRPLPPPAEEVPAAPAVPIPVPVPEQPAVPAEEMPVPAAAQETPDELLEPAALLALEAGQISEAMLQRRLKIDYPRAARLIDRLELLGLAGPAEGEKPRRVLMTREEWAAQAAEAGQTPAI